MTLNNSHKDVEEYTKRYLLQNSISNYVPVINENNKNRSASKIINLSLTFKPCDRNTRDKNIVLNNRSSDRVLFTRAISEQNRDENKRLDFLFKSEEHHEFKKVKRRYESLQIKHKLCGELEEMKWTELEILKKNNIEDKKKLNNLNKEYEKELAIINKRNITLQEEIEQLKS